MSEGIPKSFFIFVCFWIPVCVGMTKFYENDKGALFSDSCFPTRLNTSFTETTKGMRIIKDNRESKDEYLKEDE